LSAERSLHAILGAAAEQFPDRDAIRAGEQKWSFGELDRWSGALAAHLTRQGVSSGDRVAIQMANRVEFIVAVHATSRAGAAAVLLSTAWKTAETDAALGLTEPSHAIVDAPRAGLLGERLGTPSITDVDALGNLPEPVAAEEPSDDADAVLVFSSGTTGLPKAVRHTHRSMRAATADWRRALGLGPNDRFQVATPPSHILGLLNLLAATDAGAMVRLHHRFELDEELRCIEAERMTLEMAVAPIALAMANHPDLESYDLSSLRYIMWGATPVTTSVAERVTARTGIPFLPAYGASEVPVLAANPVGTPGAWRLDSPGLAPDGVELRVVDLDRRSALPAGEVGEIEARGPSTMAGYLPTSANADAFHDGWYRTGDVGWLEPDGWVHLTDRCKEMIKVNGYQVAPAEIESVLHGHPSVLDCAVFGVPDERSGEAPVAAVQLDPDHPVSAEALSQLVTDALARYKQVRSVVVVDAIPRLASGKTKRRELRDRWLAGDLPLTPRPSPDP